MPSAPRSNFSDSKFPSPWRCCTNRPEDAPAVAVTVSSSDRVRVGHAEAGQTGEDVAHGEDFDLLRRARPPKVWLVNVFAGLNRCDQLAAGIRRYLSEHPIEQPMVVRMVGNFEEEGHATLREAGIEPVRELEQAIDACARLVVDGGGAA